MGLEIILTTVLALIIILIILFYFGYTTYNVVYVKSDIDNQLYLVRDLPDKQYASNMLARIKKNIMDLNNYLATNKDNYKEYQTYIDQLSEKVPYIVIMESTEDSAYTSYSVNKGEQIVFCIRSRRHKNEIHDLNLMMYVVLHELSHVACPEYGHTSLFKKIFAFITNTAISLDMYKKIDFIDNPLEYCGLTITDSIV